MIIGAVGVFTAGWFFAAEKVGEQVDQRLRR